MMGKDDFMPVSAQQNVIANGTLVKGDITSNGDIQIDGSLEGTVVSKSKVLLKALSMPPM